MKRKIYAIITSISIVLAFTTTTYAKVDGFLSKDRQTGKMYQYSYDEVMNAAINNAMGFASPLFDEFKSRTTTGFHDDKVGYVDADAVNNAAVNAAINEITFDLQGFLDKADSSMIVPLSDTDSIQKRTESNGKVTDGEVITPGKTITPIIEVQPSPDPSKTIIVVSFAAGVDTTKYTVTINGVVATNTNGKFGALVSGIYTSEEAKKLVKVQLTDSSTEPDEEFDVIDIQ